MAGFLGLDESTFIERYTRLRASRRGLALAERANFECVFLDGRDCRVQAVKPQQCRDFPNLWRFPGCETHCRAVPREVSDAEYERLIRQATGRAKLPGRKDQVAPESGS